MISLAEAKERLFASLTPLSVEQVPLLQALGRFCAEPLQSSVDLPRFDNSAMDGYAVHCDDLKSASDTTPVELNLAGRIGAGEKFAGIISPGDCLRLFTGSILPAGADAVVMQEDVHAENGKVRFSESVKPFENIRLAGEDIRAGTTLLTSGDRLTATRLGLLAATGHAHVTVRKLPRVAVLATGDELVEPGQPLGEGKIYESNRTLVTALLSSIGLAPTILPLVPDQLDRTVATFESTFSTHDIVITTGGVSVGEFDFVKDAFSKIGGTIDHWKVAIKPGKPFVFGRLNSKLLFGLPGNPVSTLVTFLLLARPALLAMMGSRDVELPRLSGELNDAIANPGDRRHFVRARWESGKLFVAGRQASHMLGALGAANCLIDVPPETRLEPGTTAIAHFWEFPLA
ncbi:MAG: molybdopterin molybdotransferase MoeA [Limisphaerales bacterium]